MPNHEANLNVMKLSDAERHC